MYNEKVSAGGIGVTGMNDCRTEEAGRQIAGVCIGGIKRLADIGIAFIALTACIPIMLITAVAIKLDDGGSVIYRSRRMGKGGKEFVIYKFRSMRQGADQLELTLTQEEREAYYKNFKLDDDPRITRVGRFIRSRSIDEIPQFFNILKGDMELVGPRPLLRQEVEINYPDNHRLLLSRKPGLTGYWQAYGRGHAGYENGERQKMEIAYVTHPSFATDIKIIFHTAAVVLPGWKIKLFKRNSSENR
jgi:lipopolysaccharide/colanic/teichoic acid biosynthesis glycosyltransferase